MNRWICVHVWLAAMLAPSFAFASSAVTNAGVVVENYPLRLQKYQDLNFGTIAPSGDQDGSVVLSSNGQITANGGVTLIHSATATPAGYLVYGVPSASFSVTLPAEMTLNGPLASMIVREFTSSNGGTGSVPQQGYVGFTVGATLFASAGQLPGTYSGTFTVTVAYN